MGALRRHIPLVVGAVLIVVATILLVTGCGGNKKIGAAASSAAANPALSADLSHAQQVGLTKLKDCLPNGHAVIPAVMNGTASTDTAIQVALAFHGANLTNVEHACLPPGSLHKFARCMGAGQGSNSRLVRAISAAKKPYMNHPFRNHDKIIVATGQATLRFAAACVGSF